ncbi:DEAD/DEAH box helicase family protein [bacterium]|nr:DEAD/DEAH box helicase family protein [bacterium]
MLTPEQQARQIIDEKLIAAGWLIQNPGEENFFAGPGVAVREYYLGEAGYADYLLFANQKAVGVVEAKKHGVTLSGVAEQSANYAAGLPGNVPTFQGKGLPFLYQSTGIETTFRDERDPEPRSRNVFHFHRPETLAAWAEESASLRSRLRQFPPMERGALWPAQYEAILNLEHSFAEDKPRALIHMATGSGKTFTAVNFVYRLIKQAKANRVLFLVDRNNLGRQAMKEFANFETPDDGRKFTELYNVQHLQSNVLDPVSKVHITTIQRLYSMLRGEAEYDPANEEESLMMAGTLPGERPKEVVYNPHIPIEYYDFVVIDECHRSIYNLWRQVVEYFDAHLIGLTATPNNLTYGFFNGNLVQEYSRQRAVADGVNVDGVVYRIRTEISEGGSTIEAGYTVAKRDKLTRQERWELLDEDYEYEARQLDRDVVARDQIRLVVRTFKERLFSEIFPGRAEVPKTLVFAKDDAHAEEIVNIIREEFGKGDDFCKKITYKVSGVTPEQLIQDFRISYNPRIAVTVDMIATGTDVKPLEILLFMRNVKSRGLFEQMLGRGTRVISDTEFQSVISGRHSKTHFVIVDAVGVVEQEKIDPQTLDREPTVPLKKLLDATKFGTGDEDLASTLAARLARMHRQLTPSQHAKITQASGGQSLQELTNQLLDAVDPDRIAEAAAAQGLSHERAQQELIDSALRTFASHPELRSLLEDIRRAQEMVIDEISRDTVIEAGFSQDATERARETVRSFRAYLEAHRDEFAALQILFSKPYAQQRLTFAQVRELAELLRQPPNSWTTEQLWQAYYQLEKDRVRGVNAQRVLTDLVSLVRHAVELDDELAPYPEVVQARYRDWLTAQQAAGKQFSEEQRWWLDQIAAYIGVNLSISPDDFNYGAFFNRGGQVKAVQLFGSGLDPILDELNQQLYPH